MQKLGPLALAARAAPADYLGALAQLMPLTDILPRVPKIAERTTGEVMGEAAERMAKRNEITREAQDELARALAPARGARASRAVASTAS